MNVVGAMRLRLWLGVIGLVAITTAVACEGVGGTTEVRENRFSVGGAPTLQVDASNGYINVVSGPDGTINVKATITEPNDVEYEADQTGDTISVTADVKGHGIFGFGNSPGASMEITAPSNTLLELKSSNGRVEVRGIHQSGSLKTSNGRIIAVDASGEYQLDTSNGSIEFDGELTPGGNNDFDTSNGNITVKLRGKPSVNLDASTSNGSVESDLAITTESFGDNQIKGKIGDGEAELRVRTSNGSIRVK
jgi:hypothetical protein